MFSSNALAASIAASKVLAGVLMFAVLEQMLPGRKRLARAVVGAVLVSAVVPFSLAFYQLASGSGNVQTAGLTVCSGPR